MPIAVWVPPTPLPSPAIIPAPRYFPPETPADYTFAVGSWTGLANQELPQAKSRTVTWRLTPNNHEASFTYDESLPESEAIEEINSDLWILRNGFTLYRGAVGAAAETGDEDLTQSCQYSSADYPAVLARRLMYDTDTLVYTGDQSLMAWNLISQAQGKPGGTLNIVRGSGQTTGIVPPTQTFAAGSFVGANINQLAQTATGFEWDITPKTGLVTQTFDVFYPQRGTDRQKIVDYPGQISKYTRNVDPGSFARSIRGTGTDGLAAVTASDPALGTDDTRRFDGQFSDTNILTGSALSGATQKALSDAMFIQPSYTVTLNPNIWGGPNDVWVGDPVTLFIQRAGGRPNILTTLRVFELQLTLDDDSDAATVALTLGAPKPDRRWLLRTIDRRLSVLERR